MICSIDWTMIFTYHCNQWLWKQGLDHTMVKTWLNLRGSERAEGHTQRPQPGPSLLGPHRGLIQLELPSQDPLFRDVFVDYLLYA